MSDPDLDVAAVERASEHDRLWFEKHPGATERTRPLIQGESQTPRTNADR